MSQTFDQIVCDLDKMSKEEKRALRKLLDKQLKTRVNGAIKGDLAAFGWAKGRIRMSADFDAPLEDLKDYME